MVNQQFYELGTAPSVIRQLFAYGLEQAAKVLSLIHICKLVTPGGAVEICRILGRDETLRRLRAGLEKLA